MKEYWLKMLAAYLAAIATATVLGCIGSTQFTLAGLANLGIEVPPGDWVAATLHDVLGMGPLYAQIAVVAFVPAFSIAALLLRWVPGPRPFWYAVAGAASIVAAILIVRAIVGGTVIGGARTLPGLLVQALAGAVAGWCFARLSAGRRPE